MASNAIAKLQDANLKAAKIRNPPTPKLRKLKPIGHGGYGTVWKFGTNDRDVARKFFDQKALQQAEYAVVRSCATLSNSAESANIIKSFGAAVDLNAPDGEKYWIDYELAHLGDLDHELRRKMIHFPTAAAIRDLVLDCLGGLNFLHQRMAMTHNDIKPANILIFPARSRCVCKIADLGCATKIPASGAVHKVRLATWGYTAPEVFNYKREVALSDFRTTGKLDVYGLGAALYEVLEGRAVMQYSAAMGGALTLYDKERHKPNRQRQALLAWNATINAAKEFFANKFFTPIPGGMNVNEVSRDVCMTVGLMCYAKPELRPDAEECIQLIKCPENPTGNNPATNVGTSPMTAASVVCGGNSPMTAQLIAIASVGNSPMPVQSVVNVGVSPMAAQPVTNVGVSPIVVHSVIAQTKSCTKPKRKRHSPTPSDVIMIGDTPSLHSAVNVPTQLLTPPPAKKPHMQHAAAANAAAAVNVRDRLRAHLVQRAAAVETESATATSKHTLLVRLLEFVHTTVSIQTTNAELKAMCPPIFVDRVNQLFANEMEKRLPVNAIGRELFDVLITDPHCKVSSKIFCFKLRTNRSELCWENLKAQRKVAEAAKKQ